MWTEVIFTRDDLARLLAQALPLTIHLGAEESDHSLSLRELGDVQLVADAGLRITCKAHVHWPLLGIDVPVELSSLALLLLPSIEPGEGGERLVFRGSVEHADFAALPALVSDRIASALNARLAAKGAELSWSFSKTLRYVIPLPGMLEPLESFALRSAWGKVRITDEAIVVAASFHSGFVRRGEPSPIDMGPLLFETKPAAPLATHTAARGDGLSKGIAVAGALLLAAGAYWAGRRTVRSRWFA
jgi:hypothetical protein